MPRVIDRLLSEHVNLERLVRLLDRQPSLLVSPDAPNIGLLVDTLLYLTEFPDVTHHPLEDRIVERLRARDALPAGLADEIEAQHVMLARQGLALLCDLEGAVRQDTMSPEGAEANIRLYAERLRHNMAVEELALFPAAVRKLDDEDWRLIEHMTPEGVPDPLFDALVQTRFAELRRAIAVEADCGCDT
ncbi:MAG: hemerythrin domain-containing protein [Burkholderiaceae bacterium]|nr:MAG: hemerythrin domain-containing protein [Burkholderiaceae bacterium]